MKKLVTFLLLCLVGVSSSAFGQSRITGKVVDSKDQPVIGATITVIGTNLGVTTDREGNFTMNNVPEGGTLQASFIGYETISLPINGRTTFNIVLNENVQQIDELIVVGYGTAKKSDLTGSVARVGAEDLQLSSSADPLQSLQGRVAGVTVLGNSKPGSSPNMRIRGSGSISANNEPLYVVDGFPIMGDGGVVDINSNDIESIEILKDASSAAIYGSRGANGVVLITTKGGAAKNRNNLNVSAYVGIQSAARLPDALGRDQFIEFINEAYKEKGGVFTSDNPAPNYSTNWQKEIIKSSATVQDYSVSFDGGTDKTSYLFSGGYYNQEGLIPSTGYEKYSGRLKLNHEFNRWMKVGANVSYTETTQDIYDNATGDIFRFGWPTMPVKNSDGSWFLNISDPQHKSYMEGAWNPVWAAATAESYKKNNRVMADVFAEIQLAKNLSFRTNFGIDVLNGKSYNYTSIKNPAIVGTQTATNPIGSGGQGGHGSTKAYSKIWENMLTYSNSWGKHRLTGTGVYSFQEYDYEMMKISGKGFQNDATGAWNMGLATKESITYSTDKYDNRLISFTLRGAYAYDDKYLLTVTGRYDGSSRFGENNKWGFFPSVGLGWRVSEEAFMRNNRVVTNLKLRASYGQTGNQEIGNYKSLSQLDIDNHSYNNSLLQGLYEKSVANPNLKWERTHQIDVGFDLTLWNRVDLTFDYYQRVTDDLLYEVPIPSTSGFKTMLDNIGEVKNNGIEIGINARVIDREFKFDLGVNFSQNKNEITELYGGVEVVNVQQSSIGLWQQLMVGKPVNSIWARESQGLIRTQEQLTAYRNINPKAELGDEMYADHNGDKSISTADYIFLGSVEPQYTYGISMNFAYKNFTLNLFGQGAWDYASLTGADDNTFNKSGDGSSVSIGYSNLSNYMMYGENQLRDQKYIPTKYAYDRMYHATNNPNGKFPRAGASNAYLSDRTNADWSYFVLRNIKLSYDFSDLIKIEGFEGLSVYVNMQNYLSIAKKHRGYNPENGDVSHPWAKIIMFGFNARF